MNDYERKAIERCVRPVQMAIDALSLPPRKEQEMSLYRKTQPGVAICPFFGWASENIEGLGHSEDDVSLTLCLHSRNADKQEGNCREEICPVIREEQDEPANDR